MFSVVMVLSSRSLPAAGGWCPRIGKPRAHPARLGGAAGRSPRIVRPSPGYAHKDPYLRNTRRTQGRDQALVCGSVFPNSLPCVRHREGRAVTGHAPRPAGPEGGGCADARYWHRRALLAPTRVVRTSARYIPLAVSTAPSRCRQPPRSVNDPLTMPTTRVGAPRAFAPQPFRGRAGDGLTDHCWLPGRAARILESEEYAD